MAVEAKRGCGYRRVGGLYLVSNMLGEPCHKLPLPLHVCPTCHGGIKATRGWTWVAKELLGEPCDVDGVVDRKLRRKQGLHCNFCAICVPRVDKYGLIFVGAEHYPTAEAFTSEAAKQGISRRIPRLPKNFKLGETWVLVAHRKGAEIEVEPEDGVETVDIQTGHVVPQKKWVPAIISCFKPRAVELVLRQSDATAERIVKEAERGVTVVAVPDGDPDHDPKGPKQQRELFAEEVQP